MSVKPQVSIVIPVYNEGEAIVACLNRILREVMLPSEVLIVHDMPEDTTVPYVLAVAARDPRVRPILNTYGRGPANAIRFGIDAAQAPVTVVTMADGCDDPRQVDDLARLVDRGVVVAAIAVHAGGPAGRRPAAQAAHVALGGAHPAHVRTGGHQGRDEQLQGVQHRVRPDRRHRVADRVRDRPGADREGEPAAAADRRDPDHLARPAARRVPLRPRPVPAGLSAVVLLRVRPAPDRRAAGGPQPQAGTGAGPR